MLKLPSPQAFPPKGPSIAGIAAEPASPASPATKPNPADSSPSPAHALVAPGLRARGANSLPGAHGPTLPSVHLPSDHEEADLNGCRSKDRSPPLATWPALRVLHHAARPHALRLGRSGRRGPGAQRKDLGRKLRVFEGGAGAARGQSLPSEKLPRRWGAAFGGPLCLHRRCFRSGVPSPSG